jgi:cell wall-associated NlpC family hydrolase
MLALLLMISLTAVAIAIHVEPAGAATQGDAIVAAAASQAGVPYCDDGGGINGPSNGGVVETGCGAGVAGFDCMSLAQYAVYQVTGIVLPSDGSQLSGVGTVIAPSDTADLLPGDVTYWGGSRSTTSRIRGSTPETTRCGTRWASGSRSRSTR